MENLKNEVLENEEVVETETFFTEPEESEVQSASIKAKKPNGTKTMKTKRLIFVWAMLAYPILQYLIFFVWVNIDSVLMSFQFKKPLQSSINFPVLIHYKDFFDHLFMSKLPQTINAIRNSVLVGLNDILLMIISVTLAYFFYKKMPGRGVFRIIFFLPSIISIVIYTLVFGYMFNSTVGPIGRAVKEIFGSNPDWFGTENSIFMVMLYCLWVGTGYNILILGGAMANLPEEVMESAKLDGAKMRHELFLLVVPMIWPTIAVSILGSITTMFTLFIQVDLLTSKGGASKSPTIAYLINSKITGTFNNRAEASAIGLVFTVIATPIILIVKKLLDKATESFGF